MLATTALIRLNLIRDSTGCVYFEENLASVLERYVDLGVKPQTNQEH